MFEGFAIFLLVISGLGVSFFLGRIWNEVPRETVKAKAVKQPPEALVGEFVVELKKRAKALKQYSSQIDKKSPSGVQLAKLEKMSSRVDGMLNLLVAYAKLNEVQIEQTELTLQEAASRAVHEMRNKGEQVPVLTFTSLQSCVGDHTLLKQFFLILFRNTTSEKGNTRIEIGGLDGQRGGLAKFYVSVKFPAEGVDPSNPFLLYNNRRLTSSGSGRGLAFCKKIVGLQGGNLWCQGGHDGSITFWFNIPVAAVHSVH
jgi:light-regulated signal transduction histidine kinase (bacteriophytochrome)